MLHRTMVQRPNFHSQRFIMTPTFTSQSFKSAPTLDLTATLRELIAAMPIMLFFNAVRTAFAGSKTRTAR